jgi:hypothetical protein
MSKEKSNPKMDGTVSRAVDFNLKKEDLMLLILEGRKENMEAEIAKITTVSTELKNDLAKAEDKYRDEIKKMCYKLLNAEAKNLAKGFGKKLEEGEETDLKKIFDLTLRSSTESNEYTEYRSSPIGDGKGATYIKTQKTGIIQNTIYTGLKFTLQISLHGRTYANKNDMFAREPRACGEHGQTYIILDEQLSADFQRELPVYKAMMEISNKLKANESLLSDILAEYDLFNRNQPRSKAKMIKEVLGRDESGQALLQNIIDAAGSQKLLA